MPNRKYQLTGIFVNVLLLRSVIIFTNNFLLRHVFWNCIAHSQHFLYKMYFKPKWLLAALAGTFSNRTITKTELEVERSFAGTRAYSYDTVTVVSLPSQTGRAWVQLLAIVPRRFLYCLTCGWTWQLSKFYQNCKINMLVKPLLD